MANIKVNVDVTSKLICYYNDSDYTNLTQIANLSRFYVDLFGFICIIFYLFTFSTNLVIDQSQREISYLVCKHIASHLSLTELVVFWLHNSCRSCFYGYCDDQLAAQQLMTNTHAERFGLVTICLKIAPCIYTPLLKLPFFYEIQIHQFYMLLSQCLHGLSRLVNQGKCNNYKILS